MSYFQPNEAQVRTLEEMFAVAASGTGAGREAVERLKELQSSAEFFSYCAFIVAREKDPSRLVIRQLAAYYIKSNFRSPLCVQNVSVRDCLIEALGDNDDGVRRAVSSVIALAIATGGWSIDSVDKLLEGIGSQSPPLAAGCITALSHVCEDATQLLDSSGKSSIVVPALISVLNHSDATMRLKGLEAISFLLEEASSGMLTQGSTFVAFQPFIATILGTLSQYIASNADPSVLALVLRCLVMLLPFEQQIAPSFEGIVELMISKTVDRNERVQMEAIEFWRAVLAFPRFAQLTLPLMKQILPVLLECMVYSEMELGMLQNQRDDWQTPDLWDEIKPRRFQARAKRTHIHTAEDDEDDEEVEQWNLRRCAALTLDDIAEHHGDVILVEVLTVVEQKMQPSQDWRHQEAAILAIGAIAEGCFVGLQVYLEQIVSRLVELLQREDSHGLVKAICSWVISRFSVWLLNENPPLLERSINALLMRMKSPSKRVQEAATAALGTIASFSENEELSMFALPIMQTVSDCFQNYQLKNRYLLFETVESLCKCMNRRLAEEDCLGLLVEPLVAMWNDTPNDSPLLFPFFACVSAVCSAVGSSIQPMAEHIFSRSFNLIQYHITAQHQARAHGMPPPDEEFLVTSLDLLGGLFEALGGGISVFVNPHPEFMDVIKTTLVDESPNIRQSGFALFGDMCSSAVALVQQNLSAFVEIAVRNLRDAAPHEGVISNISWCIYDLCANQIDGGELPVLGPTIAEVLMPFFVRALAGKQTADTRNMAENLCLAIGSLLQLDAGILHRTGIPLSAFIGPWCDYVRNIKNIPPKDQALRGMIPVMQAYPTDVIPALPLFLDVMLSLDRPSMDITSGLVATASAIKNVMGGAWGNYYAQYDRERREMLYRLYSIQ